MGYPELPEESNDNNLNTSEIQLNNYGQNTSDESDLDEANNLEGYQPLPLTDNNEEFEVDDNERNSPEIDHGVPNIISSDAEIESQVWNQPRPQELEIELDTIKTEEIMNAMANVTLPSSAIPEWAQHIPEDKWKQDLLDRLRQRKEEIDKK